MAKHRAPSPVEFWMAGYEAARLTAEANAVVGLRLMGMAGFWKMPNAEDDRMIAEKQAAFPRAAFAAGRAMAAGRDPVAAMRAAMRPLHAKTGANVKRLSRAATR
ncbi:MAG: hypothetical protein ACFBWO_07010 [Paracoccaceae bacterium]